MKNNIDSFKFKLGILECMVIRDTSDPMDLAMLFTNKSAVEMEELLREYSIPGGETMEVMCLYIDSGDNKIIIDTGWGPERSDNSGKLPSVLKANGIHPEEIDYVIISHGHPDHIGGNTDDNGKAMYPNARYIMYRDEWVFWETMPELNNIEEWVKKEIHAYVKKNLISIQDRVDLMNSDEEILPGIRFIAIPGHSPHHCMVSITSESNILFYLSDLLQHPLQVTLPENSTFVDFDPELSIQTRLETLDRIVSANLMCFVCHFPFPGLGHIVQKSNIRVWQPIDNVL